MVVSFERWKESSKNIEESCRVGKVFDIRRITPSADCVNGVLPFSVRGDELHPSSELGFFFFLFPRDESRDSEPLSVHPLAVLEEPVVPVSVSGYSDWVVQQAKSFYKLVELSCEGYGEDLMALLTTIESGQFQGDQASPSSPLSKSANRGQQELKRLACSINYDLKGFHSSRGKGKGRGSSCLS